MVRRAQLYDRLRQYEKALPDYNQAVEAPNAGLDPLIWRTAHWAEQAQWKKAADDFRQMWVWRQRGWYFEWFYAGRTVTLYR